MNKMGRREYVRFIANILVETYGGTLMEYGTDVRMAEAVVDGMTPYLYFWHEVSKMDMSKREFNTWKKKRLTWDNCEVEFEDVR